MSSHDVFYDTVTTQIRLRYDCSAGSAAFDLIPTNIAKIPSRFTRIYSEILHESVKNTPKASTNHVRINGNLWLFLTIREIFSLN